MGTVAVYSATSYLAYTKLDGNTEFFLIQHLIRVGLAFGVMMLFSVINYRWVARMSKIGLIVALGLLLMVQILGVATNGATRWLDLGFIGFQPSDLARVALVDNREAGMNVDANAMPGTTIASSLLASATVEPTSRVQRGSFSSSCADSNLSIFKGHA